MCVHIQNVVLERDGKMKFNVVVHVFENEPTFGKGVIHILKKVDEYQSLSKAYKSMNMSSSKAWKMIHRAQEDLGFKLIDSQIGGSQGGKSSLTPEAKEFVKRYEAYCDDIKEYASMKFKEYFNEGSC